ncbi:DUF4145 domain-containing protein [Aestuariicoccus sp. KMU-90]|uniref:DUF4145 domain-containing protein n=1 Tax=Thetidibacter halocola TaxID=2827239 RepID=A0A8J8B8U1_9RHOB|nr:DUF4145 domain-containing protein [Thetidibacter halocola]
METGVKEVRDYGPVSASAKHIILRCLGCDTIFYGEFSTFSEDYDYVTHPVTGATEVVIPERITLFPSMQRRSSPKWQTTKFGVAHEYLDFLISEIITLYNSGHYTFSALGVRTGFEIAADDLGINRDLSFQDKIEQLRAKGHISPREKDVLKELVDAGSAVIHRGWQPSANDVDLLIDTLEQFIQRAIVLPEGLDTLSKKVPKKAP